MIPDRHRVRRWWRAIVVSLIEAVTFVIWMTTAVVRLLAEIHLAAWFVLVAAVTFFVVVLVMS